VEREGYTLSEKTVGEAFEGYFPQVPGAHHCSRLLQHIHRVQQVADAAIRCGRKILLNGRSMIANVRIARQLGYLSIPEEMLMDLRELPHLPRKDVCIISTGSQGEPMSALTRIAMDDHKQIKLEKATPSSSLPGHPRQRTHHLRTDQPPVPPGAQVIHERVSEVHVSGHASQEELKLIAQTAYGPFFYPQHGEYPSSGQHIELARKVGIPEESLPAATNGDVISFYADTAAIVEKIEAGRVFV
jgi:ribonuclease J